MIVLQNNRHRHRGRTVAENSTPQPCIWNIRAVAERWRDGARRAVDMFIGVCGRHYEVMFPWQLTKTPPVTAVSVDTVSAVFAVPTSGESN